MVRRAASQAMVGSRPGPAYMQRMVLFVTKLRSALATVWFMLSLLVRVSLFSGRLLAYHRMP